MTVHGACVSKDIECRAVRDSYTRSRMLMLMIRSRRRNGDYTLDYNAEATYFGSFSSNRVAQTWSYYDYLIRWMEPGRKMAAQLAAGYNITCDAATLHYVS